MSESTTPQSMAPSEKKKTSILTKPVIEWALWDWGSAAFNAVATTFVFSVYLTSDGTFTDKGTASDYLSWGLFAAGIIIALLAPITGQRADRRGKGGLALTVFTILVVICLALMFFVAPEGPLGPRGGLFLGITLLGIGNIFFEFASVNYNAMLNHLSTKENFRSGMGIGLRRWHCFAADSLRWADQSRGRMVWHYPREWLAYSRLDGDCCSVDAAVCTAFDASPREASAY